VDLQLSSLMSYLVLAADEPAVAAAPPSQSLLGFVQAGGFLSFVLVGVSVIAVGLVIANLLILRRAKMAPDHVISGLERLLRDRQVEAAVKFAKEPENESFLASVIAAGLSKCARSAFGMLELRTALEDAGAREVDRLERVNHGIGLCAAVAPMLGLLGTVIGMIGAFSTIGTMEGASRSVALSGYMSIALVTTAEGLFIAVPCTIAFSLFRRRQDRLVNELGDLAERLCQPVMGPGGAAPVQSPTAAAPMMQRPTAQALATPMPRPAAPISAASRGGTGS